MNRCKVICHMYISIDGKIDGQYMDESGCDISGEYYDEMIWKMGNADGSGRATAEMYFAHENIDYSKYKTSCIDYIDNVIKADYYWVVFDRTGKCNWNRNYVNYGNKTAQVLMVLTKKVKREYIAYLKDIGISYIFVGDNDLDLESSLIKLKTLFGIENLILCGGAVINGAFHKAGLIDELSLVVAPFIEGNHNEKGCVEVNQFINYKYNFKSITPLEDGGIHLLFSKK